MFFGLGGRVHDSKKHIMLDLGSTKILGIMSEKKIPNPFQKLIVCGYLKFLKIEHLKDTYNKLLKILNL